MVSKVKRSNYSGIAIERVIKHGYCIVSKALRNSSNYLNLQLPQNTTVDHSIQDMLPHQLSSVSFFIIRNLTPNTCRLNMLQGAFQIKNLLSRN